MENGMGIAYLLRKQTGNGISHVVIAGSYQRYCGFKNPLSAADMVYCITALTEHREADANATQVSWPLEAML